MIAVGSVLVPQGKYTEAEPLIRQGLDYYLTAQPGAWFTAYARSLLGEVLLETGRLEEAEPLLLDGQRVLAEQADNLPPQFRNQQLREAVGRLVRFYDAQGEPDQADAWRRRMILPDDVFAQP